MGFAFVRSPWHVLPVHPSYPGHWLPLLPQGFRPAWGRFYLHLQCGACRTPPALSPRAVVLPLVWGCVFVDSLWGSCVPCIIHSPYTLVLTPCRAHWSKCYGHTTSICGIRGFPDTFLFVCLFLNISSVGFSCYLLICLACSKNLRKFRNTAATLIPLPSNNVFN